jgi:hypothetical protein
MVLDMRGSCERCSRAISSAGPAFICSYECTFCEDCALSLQFMCTNCKGELVRRPKRQSNTPGTSCA